jgi:hypothetical protein
MPRYFFHIHDGEDLPDTDGTELPDLETARNEAVRVAGHVLTHIGAKFWDQEHGSEWTLDIADEQGTILAKLRFSGRKMN